MAVGTLEKIDFLLRFWELKGRSANLGVPLAQDEQVELLSLMQLVQSDHKMPEPGPVNRTRGAAPAEVIGEGVIVAVEVRSVSAAALVVTAVATIEPGARVIVRAADAVSGVEYALPCTVVWSHRGSPWTIALVVDGIPTRNDFSLHPAQTSQQTSLAMGRPMRLVG